jgi:diguanylate cyclase (GGDEF)-like protein
VHRDAHPVESSDREEDLLFAILDLDHLKWINDAHGHDAGDLAIVAVARMLESQFREGDLAVRWGGDEFVLLSRSVDRAGSTAAAERIRAAAESIDLGLKGGASCTVSIGFAVFPFIEHDPEQVSWEQTLQLADRALLTSKRRGRNSWTGFIAGAGIVVRNSIILVDFIELRLRDGLPLEQAVVDAGAVRFRPMALTAAAVIVGAGVILFDPIFQGLAISLMAGEVASLLLSRMAVPVLYYMARRRELAGPVPMAQPLEVMA